MPLEQAQRLGWKPQGASVEDALLGRAQSVDSDPRIAEAMKMLDPTAVRSNSLAASTDLTAAQAGSVSDMLRDQMGQAGIGLNDPAAQARLRSIETQRMQANQVGGREAQAAGQGAASQIAQMRLAQMSQSTPLYSLYGSMKANQQTGQYFTGSPAKPQVAAPSGGGTPAAASGGYEPWKAPPGTTQAPSTAYTGSGAQPITPNVPSYASVKNAATAAVTGAQNLWNTVTSPPNWARGNQAMQGMPGTTTGPKPAQPPTNQAQGANLGRYVTNLWGKK